MPRPLQPPRNLRKEEREAMNLRKAMMLASLVCAATMTAAAQPEQTSVAQMQARQRVSQRALTPDKLLSLGDFYYRNNDVSDKADTYYKQVIRNSPQSQTAGYAQY